MVALSLRETWLDEHLETFVRPQLGYIPNVDAKVLSEDYWIQEFDNKSLIALNLIWLQTTKLAAGRTILLPGRDVFLFEVVARMLNNYPTVFRSDISYDVAPHVKEDYTEHFCLDTGYKGSVPKAMKMKHWALVRYDYSTSDATWGNAVAKPKYQIFPKARSRVYMNLSGSLEGCPKYWTRASVQYDANRKAKAFRQTIDGYSFKSAAMLTIHVARSVKVLRPLVQKLLPFGRMV